MALVDGSPVIADPDMLPGDDIHQPRPESFTDFVKQRSGGLMRLCYLLAGSQEGAEDLLQRSLVRCYTRWSRIGDMANPEGYVRRVIISQHMSALRRRAVRLCSWPFGHPEPASREDIAKRVPLEQDLQAALNGLARKQRAAVVLTYYLDFTDEQAAQAMACSRNTVKSHRAKALKRLRRVLSPDSMSE